MPPTKNLNIMVRPDTLLLDGYFGDFWTQSYSKHIHYLRKYNTCKYKISMDHE
jgi:hypothetical protein